MTIQTLSVPRPARPTLAEPVRRPGPPRDRAVRFVRVLQVGLRAQTDLVLFRGRPAVRKTFYPGCERFLARELEVRRRYAGVRREVPELLEAGERHLVSPYYATEIDIYKKVPHGRLLPRRLMPLHVSRAAIELVRCLHADGYALMDCHPGNVLYNRRDGVKVIDYEFLYPYPSGSEAARLPFEQSYPIAGVPADFPGDLPPSWPSGVRPYERRWYGYTGLSLHSLMNDPAWLQGVKRAAYQIRTFARLHVRRFGKLVRWARRAERGRLGATVAVAQRARTRDTGILPVRVAR